MILRDQISRPHEIPRCARRVPTDGRHRWEHETRIGGYLLARYGRTLYTTSCSRTCPTTFRPKSSFGPTSVTGP